MSLCYELLYEILVTFAISPLVSPACFRNLLFQHHQKMMRKELTSVGSGLATFQHRSQSMHVYGIWMFCEVSWNHIHAGFIQLTGFICLTDSFVCVCVDLLITHRKFQSLIFLIPCPIFVMLSARLVSDEHKFCVISLTQPGFEWCWTCVLCKLQFQIVGPTLLRYGFCIT